MFKLCLSIALSAALALAAVSAASGQGPDVHIAQLQCTGDPEIVIIENRGDAAQDLTGWKLQSDPASSEEFSLSVLGGLQPGASVSIQSGPSASGVFTWGTQFVFRDNDPADYARIVNSGGAVVHEVNCGQGATPTPSPASGVPNGGGPPPPSADSLTPMALVLIGGFLAAAGGSILTLLRLRPWARRVDR